MNKILIISVLAVIFFSVIFTTNYAFGDVKKSMKLTTSKNHISPSLIPKSIPNNQTGGLSISEQTIKTPIRDTTKLITISGKADNYTRAERITVKITKPDGSVIENKILAGKQGQFIFPFQVDFSWPAGITKISTSFKGIIIGETQFIVKKADDMVARRN